MKAIAVNGSPRKGWNTDLLLQEALKGAADAVFMGSPIYLGNVSGMMYCLMEQLVFSLLSYDDYSKRLFHGHVNSCFFTMNAPKMYANTGYRGMMKQYADAMKRLGGSSEYYAACDTLQFEDYSRFAAGTFNEAHKRKVRQEQFPKDLQAAYDIGFRLIEKAK